MSDIPTDIRAHRAEGVLAIGWSDRRVELPFRLVRAECQCAQCVNEWTGERMLDPASVPPDVSAEKLDLVGGYAVRIHWSDGHSSGLYTWKQLRALAT
jgi:DUF971 family protein